MAGMLPGVECARRRRFHQSGGSSDSPTNTMTRRSSFCLYRSNHESHHSSSAFSSLRSIILNQVDHQDEKLGGIAREAKARLDERLRTQRKSSETKRQKQNGKDKLTMLLHTEVYGSKRFSWSSKLSWKAGEQEVCAICLERFKVGETLVHLPCAHRFDSRCLLPWLQTNSHCPCCRLQILLHT